MKLISVICFFLMGFTLLGQNPEGFEKMAKKMEGKNVPVITHQELLEGLKELKNVLILDSREPDEFKVSHLPNAKFVGYKEYDFDMLNNIPKDSKIVVYCSVGYRSGKTVEKLIEKGFTNVYNLHGGIFDWANNKLPIENENGAKTKSVHGYNQKWAEYLNKENVKPVLK